MEPLLYRLLVGCLVIWLMDQIIGVLKIGEPAAWVIKLVTVILAVVFILFGWALNFRL